jgi:serine/threonine protein kinase
MRVVYRSNGAAGSASTSGGTQPHLSPTTAALSQMAQAPMSAKLPMEATLKSVGAGARAATPAAAYEALMRSNPLMDSTYATRNSVSVPPPGPRQSPLQRFHTQGPVSPSMPASSREVVLTAKTPAGALPLPRSPAPSREARGPSRPNTAPPAGPSDPSSSLPSCWTPTYELNSEEPVLGGGAFAKILRVGEKASGAPYAIKVMNRPNFAIRGIEAQLDAEIEAMKRCAKNRQCRHVVRLYETAEENSHVYLRLELCKCDLLRYANSQPSMRLTESDITDFTRQLFVGLRDLHALGILHRDIKPENLLLTSDGILKIADFGWCADLKDKPSSLAGTFQYMAPEILGSLGVQTEACDVWSSGITILQLASGRPLLTTYLGPGATGISNTDPHQATKLKTQSLVDEIFQKCPMAEDMRPSDLSWRCWDCLRSMLIPEAPQRMSVDEALKHCWLEVAPADVAGAVSLQEPLSAQLEESHSSSSLMLIEASQPTSAKVIQDSSASTETGGTPRHEATGDMVPTPPCARTPVRMAGASAPRTLPAASVPTLPQSTPSSTRVAKLVMSSGLGSATQTPLPTPQPTPQATPVRHSDLNVIRCRRSETAPSPLSLQADAHLQQHLASSRVSGTEPPSPCATSRTPLSRTPMATRVKRAQTAAGEVRSPLLDSTIRTLENLNEMNFRNPALQECESRMANALRQLESKKGVAVHEGNSRGSSVGVQRMRDNGTVPDLRTFTELVKSCGQTMRRASTAVGEEVSSRRASYELRQPSCPDVAAPSARSVTLKPRCRRRGESPLRATMGCLPTPGLSTPSTKSSVVAPCSVSVPSNAMSATAPSGMMSKTTDQLSRTMPCDFLQREKDVGDLEGAKDKLMRTAMVHQRPMSVSISSAITTLKSAQSARLDQAISSGYPQRLTTSTTSHGLDRLSPRPYVAATSSRSPLLPLRASPPATPSPDTFRDVLLARSATISTVQMAVPAA